MQYYDSTLEKVSAALDAYELRALVINNNIVHSHISGFQPLMVDFYQRQKSVAAKVHPLSERKVNVPRQLTELGCTELSYRTLIKGINQHFSILKLAVMGS